MGVVYRATQVPLGRTVALKVVAPDRAADPVFHARFERETRVAATIEHPNVIPVYETGECDGRLYLVMRWVEGGDLQDLITGSGGLDPVYAARVVAQVGAGLEAAHATGLVHRDVKPANVLIGDDGHVYLTDFGLTLDSAADARITKTGELIGTADFMAPEQFEGQPLDRRSDVYALGCVLYAALAGRPPFARPTVTATMLAHLRDPPPRPSATKDVPEAFDPVVERALAKSPDERFASAAELAGAALEAGGLPPSVKAPDLPKAAGNGSHKAPTTAPTPLAAPTRIQPPPSQGPTEALPDGAPGADTARLSRPLSRRWHIAMVALLIAAVAAAVVFVAEALDPLIPGGDAGDLTGGEVRGAVHEFSRAYASEDGRALRAVLTAEVRRVTPSDSQRGRREVLREYRRQFAANRTIAYEVDDLDADGGSVGRASGRYAARRAGAGPITGRITFGLRRQDGDPKIGLIAVTPD
jgi:serine/threonine-protein kinase